MKIQLYDIKVSSVSQRRNITARVLGLIRLSLDEYADVCPCLCLSCCLLTVIAFSFSCTKAFFLSFPSIPCFSPFACLSVAAALFSPCRDLGFYI